MPLSHGLSRPFTRTMAHRIDEDGGTTVAVSLAATLLGNGVDGMAVAFNDDFYYAATGFYGSMKVVDTATPANDYANSPRSSGTATKIANSGSSLKIVRGNDGYLDFAPHNLALRSDDVGDSSWTKVATASNPSASVTAATNAYPCVVTFSGSHPFVNGQTISFVSVGGMTQLNGNVYTVANATSTTVELSGIDSTAFGTYTSGGVGSAATIANFPAVGDRLQKILSTSQSVGRTGIFSAVLSGTGTISLGLYEDGTLSWQQVTLTGTPTRYSVLRNFADTAADGRLWIERRSATSDTATAVTITDVQYEVSWYRTTPSTYIKTTSAAVYGPPFEWDTSGGLIGIRREGARTNLCLRNCDLTNAAWTATNMTTARTATGPNNRANFATTLTATAGNATILQSITSTSANRRTGCWIKRRTGSGNIDLTQDNGATWTTVTVTNDWTLVQTANATLANPTIGLRIVTNADAVDVCFFQHEAGSAVNEITSPIYTVGSVASRAVDNFTSVTSELVTLSGSATIYAHFKPLNINAILTGALIFGIGVSPGNVNVMCFLQSASLNKLRGTVLASPNSMAVEGGAASLSGDKLALAVTLNNGEFVVDGASVGTDITVNFPTTTTTDYAGAVLTASGLCAAGHLVACMIRPVRMSQADMISLTTA